MHSFYYLWVSTLDMTEQLVYAMEEAGADMIELGIPF